MFPCIIVARKPNDGARPATCRSSTIPRDELRIDDLDAQIDTAGVDLPSTRFHGEQWILESEEVLQLLDKVSERGVPLSEYFRTNFYRGTVTGANDAFLIDTVTRDRIVQSDPRSADIIRPFVRGENVERWSLGWQGEWMIFTRRGVNIDEYPGVRAHLEGHREALEPKPADWKATREQPKWPGRKKGRYQWFEIQDSIEYWREFERPKIVHQVIQYHPRYALDAIGMLGNDKTFFIPTDDRFLLAVLNSPLMWWRNWRLLTHLKDEALSPTSVVPR